MATSTANQNPCDIEGYLRDLLECPVCTETIKSVPIYQCANGHVICMDCIEKMNNCPICRNESALRRNLKLENIVQRLESIQPENEGPTATKPNRQKWGKRSVRSYGTINGPDLQANPLPATWQPTAARPTTAMQAIVNQDVEAAQRREQERNFRSTVARQATARPATAMQAIVNQDVEAAQRREQERNFRSYGECLCITIKSVILFCFFLFFVYSIIAFIVCIAEGPKYSQECNIWAHNTTCTFYCPPPKKHFFNLENKFHYPF